jgi:hypothetical protein
VVEQRRPNPRDRWEPDPVDGVPDQVTLWYVDNEKPSRFLPSTIGLVLFISFPGWVLLFAGRSGYFFSVPVTVTLVLIALATSVRTHFRDRAAVRKMELSADRRQLTLSLMDGKDVTFDVADAERVVATEWELRDGPSMVLRIQVGGRTYRTRHGPADGAQRFLGTFAEHGVPITEKTRNSD